MVDRTPDRETKPPTPVSRHPSHGTSLIHRPASLRRAAPHPSAARSAFLGPARRIPFPGGSMPITTCGLPACDAGFRSLIPPMPPSQDQSGEKSSSQLPPGPTASTRPESRPDQRAAGGTRHPSPDQKARPE
ncbi:hypothetical protein B2J93_1341 [Marssonina coronariae]|uniref:Uncharacterized protein n=1 Tax=Diplocarpon coronariae TaxID=2795749 RepID=A0A218Z9P5_9HELO|nr:hypothetical protein B2J93_1341 [Marssonina coronariae]